MDETANQSKLNEEFFRKQNAELLDKLRLDLTRGQLRDELTKASGIRSAEVLDMLIEAQISPETIPAIKLVPLLMVAWSDGVIQPKEREVILRAASGSGITPNTTAYGLLEGWLSEKPPAGLIRAWKEYVSSITKGLSPAAVRMLREELLDTAEEIATAAGGILGLGSISQSEKKVLKELHDAFPTTE